MNPKTLSISSVDGCGSINISNIDPSEVYQDKDNSYLSTTRSHIGLTDFSLTYTCVKCQNKVYTLYLLPHSNLCKSLDENSYYTLSSSQKEIVQIIASRRIQKLEILLVKYQQESGIQADKSLENSKRKALKLLLRYKDVLNQQIFSEKDISFIEKSLVFSEFSINYENEIAKLELNKLIIRSMRSTENISEVEWKYSQLYYKYYDGNRNASVHKDQISVSSVYNNYLVLSARDSILIFNKETNKIEYSIQDYSAYETCLLGELDYLFFYNSQSFIYWNLKLHSIESEIKLKNVENPKFQLSFNKSHIIILYENDKFLIYDIQEKKFELFNSSFKVNCFVAQSDISNFFIIDDKIYNWSPKDRKFSVFFNENFQFKIVYLIALLENEEQLLVAKSDNIIIYNIIKQEKFHSFNTRNSYGMLDINRRFLCISDSLVIDLVSKEILEREKQPVVLSTEKNALFILEEQHLYNYLANSGIIDYRSYYFNFELNTNILIEVCINNTHAVMADEKFIFIQYRKDKIRKILPFFKNFNTGLLKIERGGQEFYVLNRDRLYIWEIEEEVPQRSAKLNLEKYDVSKTYFNVYKKKYFIVSDNWKKEWEIYITKPISSNRMEYMMYEYIEKTQFCQFLYLRNDKYYLEYPNQQLSLLIHDVDQSDSVIKISVIASEFILVSYTERSLLFSTSSTLPCLVISHPLSRIKPLSINHEFDFNYFVIYSKSYFICCSTFELRPMIKEFSEIIISALYCKKNEDNIYILTVASASNYELFYLNSSKDDFLSLKLYSESIFATISYLKLVFVNYDDDKLEIYSIKQNLDISIITFENPIRDYCIIEEYIIIFSDMSIAVYSLDNEDYFDFPFDFVLDDIEFLNYYGENDHVFTPKKGREGNELILVHNLLYLIIRIDLDSQQIKGFMYEFENKPTSMGIETEKNISIVFNEVSASVILFAKNEVIDKSYDIYRERWVLEDPYDPKKLVFEIKYLECPNKMVALRFKKEIWVCKLNDLEIVWKETRDKSVKGIEACGEILTYWDKTKLYILNVRNLRICSFSLIDSIERLYFIIGELKKVRLVYENLKLHQFISLENSFFD